MRISKLKKLDADIIERWHRKLETGADEFLDFAVHINRFGILYNGDESTLFVLFENGNNYTVDTAMLETDGDMERDIILALAEYGISFDEVEGAEL